MFRCALFSVSAVTALLSAGSVYANDDMRWQTNVYKEQGNKGRYTATLTFGVPETDNRIFQATCKPGGSPNYIPAIIGYNTGRLGRGRTATLRFVATGRAGRATYRLTGKVFQPESGEGVYGVRVRPKTNDELWQLLSKYRTVRYRMRGKAEMALSLKGSSLAIKRFLRECRGIIGDS